MFCLFFCTCSYGILTEGSRPLSLSIPLSSQILGQLWIQKEILFGLFYHSLSFIYNPRNIWSSYLPLSPYEKAFLDYCNSLLFSLPWDCPLTIYCLINETNLIVKFLYLNHLRLTIYITNFLMRHSSSCPIWLQPTSPALSIQNSHTKIKNSHKQKNARDPSSGLLLMLFLPPRMSSECLPLLPFKIQLKCHFLGKAFSESHLAEQ